MEGLLLYDLYKEDVEVLALGATTLGNTYGGRLSHQLRELSVLDINSGRCNIRAMMEGSRTKVFIDEQEGNHQQWGNFTNKISTISHPCNLSLIQIYSLSLIRCWPVHPTSRWEINIVFISSVAKQSCSLSNAFIAGCWQFPQKKINPSSTTTKMETWSFEHPLAMIAFHCWHAQSDAWDFAEEWLIYHNYHNLHPQFILETLYYPSCPPLQLVLLLNVTFCAIMNCSPLHCTVKYPSLQKWNCTFLRSQRSNPPLSPFL